MQGALLNGLSNKITLLYKYTNSLVDLEGAVQLAREVIAKTPHDHPNRPSYLTNLASKLHIRHERTEREEDLEEAISAAREAIGTTSPENVLNLAGRLNNLGLMLTGRYKQSCDTAALQEAVESLQRAVNLTPEGHANRAGWLDSLGIGLKYLLFEFTGEVHYINEAVRIAQDAVNSTPENDRNLSSRLNNLGSKHGMRYSRLLDVKDLEEAIDIGRRAVNSTPNDDPRRSGFVNNLVNRLESRYRRFKSTRDLEEAIQLAQRAVEDAAETDPARVNCMSNLGVLLERRYDEEHNPPDIERAVELARGAAAEQPLGVALTRMLALRTALLLLRNSEDWNQSMVVVEAAVKLIPQICSRYAAREDQQHAVIQISGLAADACAVLLKLGNTEKAVELLELGRGLIIGYTIDGLDDLSRLQSMDGTLAQRYRTLKTQASMPIDGWDSVGRERLFKERREAVYAIDACIHDIRQTVPGQERFLLGPTVEEMKRHAVEGPIVVVNVTDIASDAIIVSHNVIKSLPLPGLSNRQVDYRDRDIGGDDSDEDDLQLDQLAWLWVHCVKPVLDELRLMGLVGDPNEEDLRRVWWIGSGIASSFPFHAAGDATAGALDYIISSYTPTIKTLGYAREKSVRTNTAAVEKSSEARDDNTILVVTMSTTPGHKPLPGAQRECDAIEKVVATAWASAPDSASSSSLHKPSKVLRLPQPCVRDVLGQILHSQIVHFACHGSSDAEDPSRSHLMLQRDSDGDVVGRPSVPVVDRLTIAKLAKVVAAHPVTGSDGSARIAFLSACSTAEVRTHGLSDEGLHMASAFQMAGFMEVVASLWSVDDDICVALAELFYSRLLGTKEPTNQRKVTKTEDLGIGRRAAEALRYAVMCLKANYPDSPFLWAPFVHFGP
ncbi:hypothetical protein GQ53DRAFT_681623 [Thozetella sp. PMI_491]|nr:hypothetical protein GQ53DRAFT_681623 [Thozetella sp. PMI_491]